MILALKSPFPPWLKHLLSDITNQDRTLASGGAMCPGHAVYGGCKAIVTQTQVQATFHYHHGLAILNNVKDKILLPKKYFVAPSFKQLF